MLDCFAAVHSKNMKRTILNILFLAFALTLVGQKQELSVAERNAQMGFNDTIDRLEINKDAIAYTFGTSMESGINKYFF